MRLTYVAILFSAVGALMVGAATDDNGNDGRSPFRAAALAPADVHMLLQIDDAAALRAELADRPIARWITAIIETSDFHQAWEQLAADAGVASGELFDRCFGREVTVMHRRSAAGDELDEWALITNMPIADSTDLLRRLQPRTLRSRERFSIYEFPEHDLLLARRNGTLVIGPRRAAGLVQTVLSRLGSGADASDSLIASDDFTDARGLTRGDVALFIRHKPPLGGHSAAVLYRGGTQFRLKHRATFDAPPFARAVTKLDIDASPLEALEEDALVAMIEPADIGSGPLETFILASLGEGLLSPNVRRRVDDRRIIVLGEIEGRQEDKPIDILAPTISLALELDDAEGVLSDMDQQAVKLVERLKILGGNQFTIDVPSLEHLAARDLRQIDISSATRWFTGSLPIARPMTLNWTLVEDDDQRYAIFATHPDALRDTAAALRRAPATEDAHAGRFQSCGSINGVRIAHHLESWAERSDLFLGADAMNDGADAEKSKAADVQEEFRQTLKLMAMLAGGIERLRWRLVRPSTHDMELDVSIRLSAPESAHRE